jgi:hypothetical protein
MELKKADCKMQNANCQLRTRHFAVCNLHFAICNHLWKPKRTRERKLVQKKRPGSRWGNRALLVALRTGKPGTSAKPALVAQKQVVVA